MAELEPFSDSCDAFELELLRSTRGDAPAPGAATKALLTLGLAPASAAAAAASVTTSASAGQALAVWSIVKGLGIGLLAGGGLMFAADQVRGPATPPQAAPSVLLGTRPDPRAASALPSPAASGIPMHSANPEARSARPLRVDSKAEASAAAPPSPEQASLPLGEAAFAVAPSAEPATELSSKVSLAEQVSVIDAARRALKSGRPSEALGSVRAYDQRWPDGPLRMEAAIVRVEAELALGDRMSAERDAKRVIAALPDSRYAARMRQLFSPPLRE